SCGCSEKAAATAATASFGRKPATAGLAAVRAAARADLFGTLDIVSPAAAPAACPGSAVSLTACTAWRVARHAPCRSKVAQRYRGRNVPQGRSGAAAAAYVTLAGRSAPAPQVTCREKVPMRIFISIASYCDPLL